MTQAELEKKLEEIIKPIVKEAIDNLAFEMVDTMAVEIIDRGLEEYWYED